MPEPIWAAIKYIMEIAIDSVELAILLNKTNNIKWCVVVSVVMFLEFLLC
ncbi:MAG: hypothetical protein KAJ14_08640 [Candidatus Omnitrophica bacterium]|nr:hypothetical protein [Candidatus Omnitrophota bacterium]MCK5493163.1 hypothetical protein [Candidatus Omnitrophota bacterium]